MPKKFCLDKPHPRWFPWKRSGNVVEQLSSCTGTRFFPVNHERGLVYLNGSVSSGGEYGMDRLFFELGLEKEIRYYCLQMTFWK